MNYIEIAKQLLERGKLDTYYLGEEILNGIVFITYSRNIYEELKLFHIDNQELSDKFFDLYNYFLEIINENRDLFNIMMNRVTTSTKIETIKSTYLDMHIVESRTKKR